MVNKTREALILAEDNFILYLGLADIETLKEGENSLSLEDITLSIFYSFSAYFHGDFVKFLKLSFSQTYPYFSLQTDALNPILKDIWE